MTLSLNPQWLKKGSSTDVHENRLENLQSHLGSAYLGEGITIKDVTNDGLAKVYLNALKRKIAEGLAEQPGLDFFPLGCYKYSDSTLMLTVTGAFIASEQAPEFLARTQLNTLDLSSAAWEIHNISVPDLSLRERLELDRHLTGQTAEQIGDVLGFKFEEDEEESLELIRNYMKLYRFYPNLHRVQL